MIPAVVLSFAWLFGGHPPPPETADIVVYGGTSAGVIAAAQARDLGRSVILIEPTQHIGGMTVSGLGATDIGNKAAIGGLAREFYRRIGAEYAKADAVWLFEPHVAEHVFEEWIRAARVNLVRGERLDLKFGVRKNDRRIASIVMESGKSFAGRVFIDATYEGDLMALAGIRFAVGREANAQYDETLNGLQTANALKHQFSKPVDPYVRKGDPASGLLPGIESSCEAADGEGDKRIQAYCFRLCTTDQPANRRPWTKPREYDPRDYELLMRNFEAGDERIPWHRVMLPNHKTDTNNNFAVSTDFIGRNYDYPLGDYATREGIVAAHRSWQEGLLWTLANDPRAPDKVRDEFQRWGLSRDEFRDNDNWPYQLYIREARRLVGEYVVTQHDCQGRRRASDPVGLAAYTMDSHNVQRYVDKNGHVRNEGDVQVGGFPPYPISYRAIVPKATECTNLLVPVCLSASHIAYGSIRMEPVFMILGQSAAFAADEALRRDVDVQSIPYDAFAKRLRDAGQILEWNESTRQSAR